jgi:hypothetical protein
VKCGEFRCVESVGDVFNWEICGPSCAGRLCGEIPEWNMTFQLAEVVGNRGGISQSRSDRASQRSRTPFRKSLGGGGGFDLGEAIFTGKLGPHIDEMFIDPFADSGVRGFFTRNIPFTESWGVTARVATVEARQLLNFIPQIPSVRQISIHCNGSDPGDSNIAMFIEQFIMFGGVVSEFLRSVMIECHWNKHWGKLDLGVWRDEILVK